VLGGIGTGVVVTLALARMITATIPLLGDVDGRSVLFVTVAMLAVSLAAMWAPAHTATLVDPAATLRFE
jgi:ABC-type lipoprotein release transport system permease subunit